MNKEINDLVSSQRDYFIAGRTRPVAFRKAALTKLRNAIKENQDRIVEALKLDFGKPEFETLSSEILVTLQEISHARKNVGKWMKPDRASGGLLNIPSKAHIQKEPYGVVLIMAPWNYPLFLVMAPLVGAIAAGNCAVVKPSEHTPHTTDLIIEMLDKIFDPSYIKVVKGDHELGASLLKERFDFIFFTGSTRVGRMVMKSAAESLTPLVLELGGKSPCIVHYDADLKAAAKRIAWGKYLNGGQTCIAPDYLLVHEKVKEEFVSLLKEQISVFMIRGEASEYCRVINKPAFERLEGYLREGKVLHGGKTNGDTLFFEPTLLEVEGYDAGSMQEEIFGPVLPLLTYNNLEGAIDQVRGLPKPMVVYYFGKSKRLQKIALTNIPSGDFVINDTVMHFTSPGIPVGGVGFSGIGKYHGRESFRAFSHFKSVLKKPARFEIPLRYPPYSRYLGTLKKMIRYLY